MLRIHTTKLLGHHGISEAVGMSNPDHDILTSSDQNIYPPPPIPPSPYDIGNGVTPGLFLDSRRGESLLFDTCRGARSSADPPPTARREEGSAWSHTAAEPT